MYNNSNDIAANQRVNEQIRLLKEALNELVPISKLPVELLLLVFKHSHLYGFAGVVDAAWMYRTFKWKAIISVSHVCRSWRSAALGLPSLWAHIICSTPAVMEEMLSRSKSDPLSFFLERSFPTNGTINSFVSRLLDTNRLQDLRLCLSERDIQLLFGAMTGNNASLLRVLMIHVENNRYRFSPDTVPLALHILALPMPRLQHLYLIRCRIPWDSLSNCNILVSLRLEPSSKPSRTQFYNFLAANPNIESLYLTNATPEESDGHILPARLPKLFSCTIYQSSLSECVDFQTHVMYPADRAEIYVFPKSLVADVPLAKVLVSSCWGSEQAHRSCLLINLMSNGQPSIVLSQLPCACRRAFDSPSGDSDDICATVNLTHTMSLSPEDGDEGRQPGWLEVISLPGLQSVTVSSSSSSLCSMQDWLDLFARHPGITRLHVSYETVPKLILTALFSQADVTTEERGLDNIPAGMHLPNLATLILDPLYDRVAQDTVGALLYKCLSQRRNCGLQPVRRLQLMGKDG